MQQEAGRAAAATAAWDAALATIDDQQAWVDSVLATQREVGLVYGGEPALRVARPRLLEPADVADDQSVLDAVAPCLVAAGALALSDETIGRRFVGSWLDDPALARLLRLPPGYPQEITLGRFDGVRRRGGLQVMEFNGGLSGGVLPADLSAEVVRGWPPFAAVSSSWELRADSVVDGVLAGLVTTWHAFGGTGPPTIACVLPDELAQAYGPSLAYVVAAGRGQGLELLVCDPGALTRAGGALRLDGRRIDVALRIFLTTMIGALADRLEPLVAAVAAGEVCLVTSARSGLYAHKALFAMVTDPDVDLDVAADVRAHANRHLPWTRLVTAGATTAPDGSRHDLLRYAADRRADLVLKPVDGFGGHGVTLGWEADEVAWQAALARAAAAPGGWVVQARIDTGTDTYPRLAPGFPPHDFVTDHNPLVADRRIVGYYVRLAETGGITNAVAGASVAPTFLVTETGGATP